MLDVLSFVYDNYWHSDACPELPALQRKLSAVGFDGGDIEAALLWLEDLKSATRHLSPNQNSQTRQQAPPLLIGAPPTPTASMRLLSPAEQTHVGQQAWGFLLFLISAGALPAHRLELVLDRLMATPGNPIDVDHLKLVVLMVFWSLGEEPSALILDELCDTHTAQHGRSGH